MEDRAHTELANARFAMGTLIQHSGFLESHDQLQLAKVDTVFRSASNQAPMEWTHKVMEEDEEWCEVKTCTKNWKITAAEFRFVPSEPLKGLTNVILDGVKYSPKYPFLDSDKLEKLTLKGVPKIVNIMSGLGNYQKLSRICIEDDNQMSDLLPLAACASLVKVQLSSCSKLTDVSALERCPALTSLDISSCDNIRDLPKCRKLVSLQLKECSNISDISVLQSYKMLSQLTIDDCENITDISVLPNCSYLQSLHIDSESIIKMSPIGRCSKLTRLNLNNSRRRKREMCISFLENCTSLVRLDITADRRFKGTSVLGKLPSLKQISISTNIAQIGHCKNLVKAEICLRQTQCTTLAGIENCHALQDLKISGSSSVSDISALGKCKSLTKLKISDFENLKCTIGLNGCVTLRELRLMQCLLISEIYIPSACQNLKIHACPKLTSLSVHDRYNQLSQVNILYCETLVDISALAYCELLKNIDVGSCHELVDISALGQCPALLKVSIDSCNNISDVSALIRCTHLSQITISQCRKLHSISNIMELHDRISNNEQCKLDEDISSGEDTDVQMMLNGEHEPIEEQNAFNTS